MVNSLFDTLWWNNQWIYDGNIPQEYLFPKTIDTPADDSPDNQLPTETLEYIDYYISDTSNSQTPMSNVTTLPLDPTDPTRVANLPPDLTLDSGVAHMPLDQTIDPGVAHLPPNLGVAYLPPNPRVAQLPLDSNVDTRVALLPPVALNPPGVAANTLNHNQTHHLITQMQQSQEQLHLDNTPP